MRVILAAVAVVLCTAGPAGGLDADRRLGARPDRHDRVRLPVDRVAPLRPDARCLVVRVVPIGAEGGGGRSLLYRPCDPPVETPPYVPYDGRPPVLIPVEPGR